ncbi:MAG TPA: proline--tRNA ligase, partial [Candidatus Nitrosocosmicus sp.]|nr:proline--tRNA ligase [Candidatus Nitrosocosmicus sp.]
IRINIGQRDIEKNTVEIVRRDNRKKTVIPVTTISKEIEIIFQALQSDLYRNALEFLKDRIRVLESIEEFKSLLDAGQGGFLVSRWCGKEECEVKIKEETGADIRVIPFDIKDMPIQIGNETAQEIMKHCIICRQEANQIAVFARAY